MAVNKHFHTSNSAAIATEKSLYNNLVAEAIQIYGHDVYYMDRTLVNEDTILGIDPLSKFKDAAKIEMYMEDADGGFAGERELISQFGLENLSEATFVVNKLRFQEMTKQIMIESGTSSEEGGSILLEEGSLIQSTDAGGSILINATDSSSSNSGDEFLLDGTDSSSTDAGDKIILNATAVDSYSKLEGSDFYILSETAATDSDRPLEGDALYHPILEKMFQINFVDHDEPFHQLDNNPVYKLRCRLFDYGMEALDTGISDIDAIETTETLDALIYQFTLEQSSAVNEDIRLENGITNAGLALLDGTDLNFERMVLNGTDLHFEKMILSGTDSSSTNAGDNIRLEGGDSSDGILLNETSETVPSNRESNVRLEGGDSSDGYLLNENSETSTSNAGDNISGEDDTTSVGESIILEQPADSGDAAYLLNEDYIVGDFDTDTTTQNELFEVQSRSVLDFSESNPFGDVGSSS